MTVASRAVMMAVMTEARATEVEQEGHTSHWVEVKGGAVLTSRVVAVEESPAPILLYKSDHAYEI